MAEPDSNITTRMFWIISLRPFRRWLLSGLCLLALGAMGAAYLPTVRFYGLPGAWVLTLPFAAVLFLAMTVSSALNYRRGLRARWKGRDYAVTREQQAGEDASGGAPRR